jgi:hypothetical protein
LSLSESLAHLTNNATCSLPATTLAPSISPTDSREFSSQKQRLCTFPLTFLLRHSQAMAAHHHRSGHVGSVDELLVRIRTCVAQCPPEAVISLTINTWASTETTVFHLSVHPDGSLVSSCAEEPPSSTSSKVLTSEQSPSPGPHPLDDDGKSDARMVDEGQLRHDNDSSMEKSVMDVDPPSNGDGAQRNLSTRGVDEEELPTARSPPESSNIRRSARQQHPPDRLLYLAAASSLGAKRAKVASEKRRADPEVSTDTESVESCESSTSSAASSNPTNDDDDDGRSTGCKQRDRAKKLKKHQHQHPVAHNSHATCKDTSDELQVAALVRRLQEAYSQEQKTPDLESASKEAVLQLRRDIMGEGQDADQGAVEADLGMYRRCAISIDRLISTSTAMRMLGYYLRGALATRLKRSHKNNYVRSARSILGLKSSADITACPAFYAFVQQHCPSVASSCTGTLADIEAWLQEPIFLADIGWSEWRRYLGKTHRRIVDAAMERFKASLLPPRDWMELGWVEEYDDAIFGRGVRAVCDIPASNQRREGSAVVADLNRFSSSGPQPEGDGATSSTPWYRIEWHGGKQALDAEGLWLGRINHLPMSRCNLKLLGNGRFIQRRDIAVGEALFDYGVQWWTHRVTGVTWDEWMTTGTLSSRKGAAELFHRMHESVFDYTPLLCKEWDKRLGAAKSEVEREAVVMDIWEVVASSEEQDREHRCDVRTECIG